MPVVAFTDGPSEFVPYTGTWGVGVAYPAGALVDHQGQVFYAVQPSTGVTPVPGPVWALASWPVPRPTIPGPQGIQGPSGATGSQGVPGPNLLSVVKLTADETGKTDATLANTSLILPVTSGVYYTFQFTGLYRSTVLTVGLKVALTVPTFTTFTAQARIGGVTADGTGSEWQGVINTSGDAVTGTAVAAINVDLPFVIEGVILPSAGGNVTVQYAAETTGATVTLRRGSVGVRTTIS